MFLVWSIDISIITDHKSLKEYLSYDDHYQNFNVWDMQVMCDQQLGENT